MKIPSIIITFAAFALARALPAAPDAALVIRDADANSMKADTASWAYQCGARIYNGTNWEGYSEGLAFKFSHLYDVICSMRFLFPFWRPQIRYAV